MSDLNNTKKNTRPNDYIISGYYGSGNFGDDLTLGCLLMHLKDKKGAVLSNNPERTYAPDNVEIIHRFSMKRINALMKETKVVLLGSGSILQDATSFRSFFYYYVIMRMAIHHKCKTMLYANGIGPIIRKQNLRRLKKLLQHIDCITVRDQDSYDFLAQLGCTKQVTLTADDSFSITREMIKPIIKDPKVFEKKLVGISFKIDPQTEEYRLDEIASALQKLADQHQLYYYMLPFHYEQDAKMLYALCEKLPNVSEFIDIAHKPEELVRYIAATDYQIFERLHGQILSTMLNIPFLPISYDLKISAFAQQVGLSDLQINHDDQSADLLIKKFEALLDRNEAIRDQLTRYTEQASQRVKINREKLLNLIEESK